MGDEKTESKRDRVRRLFIQPMNDLGFRRNALVKVADFELTMTKITDALTYMSDHSLGVMFDMLKSKGQGRDHDFWPSRAAILSFAELVEPRELEELPSLIRWFRSIEGPKALRDGTLVETWAYFRKFKKPPVGAKLQIQRTADDNSHKLELYRERIQSGKATRDEVIWVDRYEKRLAYCEALVTDVQQGDAA